MNVLRRGNHSLLSSLMLATFRPFVAVELLVNFPFNALIVSEVFLPEIPRSFASWSNMNAPGCSYSEEHNCEPFCWYLLMQIVQEQCTYL